MIARQENLSPLASLIVRDMEGDKALYRCCWRYINRQINLSSDVDPILSNAYEGLLTKSGNFHHEITDNTDPMDSNIVRYVIGTCRYAIYRFYSTRLAREQTFTGNRISFYDPQRTWDPNVAGAKMAWKEDCLQEDRSEVLQYLDLEISDLPIIQRDAMLLRAKDFTINQIATALSIPIGTVNDRLSRARKKLKEVLQNHKRELSELV